MSNLHFYKNIRPLRLPVSEVLEQERHFTSFPGKWHVIVTDIENSTHAVQAGSHDNVNLIATGSLITAINIAKTFHTEVPSFFGGDGGVIVVPDEMLNKVLVGLNAHQANSLVQFGLYLRVGHMPVEEVYNAGHSINVAKVAVDNGFNKPLITGSGLQYAETSIKQAHQQKAAGQGVKDVISSELYLDGLECRWDHIKPPTNNQEIMCLLVEARNPDEQGKVYAGVLKKLDEIYGDIDKRHPVSIHRLKLLLAFNKIYREMVARYSSWNIWYFIKLYVEIALGKLFFAYDLTFKSMKGSEYLAQVIAFSETLTIDGRLNTIISGKKEHRITLLAYLNEQERRGMLVYGHHVSSESVMSCYIEDLKDKHIHFIDGSKGGYTQASKELKPKLKGNQPDKLS